MLHYCNSCHPSTRSSHFHALPWGRRMDETCPFRWRQIQFLKPVTLRASRVTLMGLATTRVRVEQGRNACCTNKTRATGPHELLSGPPAPICATRQEDRSGRAHVQSPQGLTLQASRGVSERLCGSKSTTQHKLTCVTMYTQTNTHTHTDAHTHTQTHTRARSHAHTHTHTHRHTHTHTHTEEPICFLGHELVFLEKQFSSLLCLHVSASWKGRIWQLHGHVNHCSVSLNLTLATLSRD